MCRRRLRAPLPPRQHHLAGCLPPPQHPADYFTAVMMWLEGLGSGAGGPPLSELAEAHTIQRLADLASA